MLRHALKRVKQGTDIINGLTLVCKRTNLTLDFSVDTASSFKRSRRRLVAE